MFLAIPNYLGFMVGEYAYYYNLQRAEDLDPFIASLYGGVWSGIIGSVFWATKLVNPTNRLLALIFGTVTYGLYGYAFNKQLSYHMKERDDKDAFASYMLNGYKWATINAAFFGYGVRWTDNQPNFAAAKYFNSN